MEIIAVQPGTQIAQLVKLVGSRKKKAILARPTTQVTLSGTYWDGGSRSSYFLVDLNTQQVQPCEHYNPPQFGGPRQDPVVTLAPHQAVVEAGVFCGRPATPTIYFHPDHKM